MEKVKFDVMTNMIYPMPTVILGSMIDGKANFMTLGWIVRANFAPPIIAIGLGKIPRPHYTNLAIDQSKTFSLNFPNMEMIKELDYCGNVSGEKIDKSEIFDLTYGELKTAPMIKNCSVNLELKVVNVVDMESTTMYFGEVVGSYCNKDILTDGKIDFNKHKPVMWTSPDEQYWSVGENLGTQGQVGKNLF